MIRWTCVFLLLSSATFGGDTTGPAGGPFADDLNDIRNRLHRVLFVRIGPDGNSYGHDAVDPLLWRDSQNLLEGTRNQAACDVLDEFLAANPKPESPQSDRQESLQRAVLQNDLWSVFDWTWSGDSSNRSSEHKAARRRLRVRLAAAIRRLALPRSEIESLPDSYQDAVESGRFANEYHPDHPANAFLPSELFDPDGPWVFLYDTPSAPMHVDHFSRSTFLVLIKLPGGRKAALDYFGRLNRFPNPIVLNESPFSRIGSGAQQRRVRGSLWRVNPDLPQIPVGTQVALVRRMILIDSEGEMVESKICQMVQLRVYRKVPPGIVVSGRRQTDTQDFYEFRMSRSKLFSGKSGGLNPVDLNQPSYTTFMSHGEVDFHHPPATRACSTCHQKSGIHSVQSYVKFDFSDAMHGAQLKPIAAGREQDVYWALRHKKRKADWGLLRGFWESDLAAAESTPGHVKTSGSGH